MLLTLAVLILRLLKEEKGQLQNATSEREKSMGESDTLRKFNIFFWFEQTCGVRFDCAAIAQLPRVSVESSEERGYFIE